MSRGEQLLTAAFGLFGLIWVLKARDLSYMEEFAPGAGFLPFWLGAALILLSAAVVVAGRRRAPVETREGETPRPGKVAGLVIGLLACSALVQPLGFVLPVAAYLLYVVRWVERRSWTASLGLAAGTTASIFLVFRVWLGVPLPRGPWGF